MQRPAQAGSIPVREVAGRAPSGPLPALHPREGAAQGAELAVLDQELQLRNWSHWEAQGFTAII